MIDVDINTGNRPNTTQGQAVRLGAFRKSIGTAKIRKQCTYTITQPDHVIKVVQDWDYSYSVARSVGVIIVQSERCSWSPDTR